MSKAKPSNFSFKLSLALLSLALPALTLPGLVKAADWWPSDARYVVEQGQLLSSNSQAYAKLAEQHCTGEVALPELQQAWYQSYLAYLPLQGSALGPLVDLKHSWAMSYWPDKKDTVGRKVKAALKQASEQTSPMLSNLRAHSYLLFELQDQQQRCVLLPVSAKQFSEDSAALAQALAQDFMPQAPKAQQQASLKQMQSDLVNSYRLQTTTMLRKLRAIYSKKHGKLRPYQGEAWRPQQSMALLRAQLGFLELRYTHNLAPQLGELDSELAQQVAEGFIKSLAVLPKREPHQEQTLDAWRLSENYLAALDALFTKQVPAALGVTLGFNNNDGD